MHVAYQVYWTHLGEEGICWSPFLICGVPRDEAEKIAKFMKSEEPGRRWAFGPLRDDGVREV